MRDAGYHLIYLAEALKTESPALFVEYLAWVKVLFAGLKFPGHVLPTTLAGMRQALAEKLPPDLAADAIETLDASIRNLAEAPLDGLARQFLQHLLTGERRAASCLILDAVQPGTPLKEIYLRVFQRTQREIGRLWQTNQISVAQEHFCTAATQMIMSQLYPYIFTGERKSRRMVLACVGGELHEIGARMGADGYASDAEAALVEAERVLAQ